MKILTISSKGQIVIPKEIREKLGLKRGKMVKITAEGNKIVIVPFSELPSELFVEVEPKAVEKVLREAKKADERKIQKLLAAIGA